MGRNNDYLIFKRIWEFLNDNEGMTIHQISLGTGINWETCRNKVNCLKELRIIKVENVNCRIARCYLAYVPKDMYDKRVKYCKELEDRIYELRYGINK